MPKSPSELIDAKIEDLDDWRGGILARLRALIKEAEPEVAEEWEWGGTPVRSHSGIVCTGETHKTVVKRTFAKGACLKDPAGLFNSSLDDNARPVINFHEGDARDEVALKALIRDAVALDKSSAPGPRWLTTPTWPPDCTRLGVSAPRPRSAAAGPASP